jgi:hypothetical protein
MYIFSPGATSDTTIEVAHPVADWNTEDMSAEVFRVANAEDLFVAGAHRDANADESADVAHASKSVFHAAEPDRGRWYALQIWLESGERSVVIPYASVLAEKTGNVAVRLRRDFSVVLSLIKAHAILHQATRERDEDERIVATIADYSRVRGLVSGLIAEGVEATVPKTVRETVEAVRNTIEGWGKEHATNKDVAEELEIDKAAALRRVRTAIGRGYLKNNEDRKGHPAQLVIGEAMPEDQDILPSPEDLEEEISGCTVDRVSEGIQHPPPPLEPSDSESGGGGAYIPLKITSTDQPSKEKPNGRERFAL